MLVCVLAYTCTCYRIGMHIFRSRQIVFGFMFVSDAFMRQIKRHIMLASS